MFGVSFGRVYTQTYQESTNQNNQACLPASFPQYMLKTAGLAFSFEGVTLI